MSTAIEARFRLARRHRRLASMGYGSVLLVALGISMIVAEVYPSALIDGVPRAGTYLAKLIPDLRWAVLAGGATTPGSFAYWMYRADSWLWLLFETSQMAALATFGGAILALPLSFLAAGNITPNRWVYRLTRRLFESLRSVPELVFALILVWTFGVGPLAGILAIMLHTVGTLGKLFAEAAENASPGPWEAMTAVGATWPQSVRFAILPQVLPNFLSYILLRFEINVRGATVIGFVGAGGIGQELYSVISFNYYQEIGAIVVLIVLAVSLIDLTSERLRRAVIE